MKDYIIKDIGLADEGKQRIEWARRHMPVLSIIKDQFKKEKPLEGINVVACLHVTVETANLIYTMKAGGANIALAASNPLSTQDDVAAALASDGIKTYAIKGENEKQYYECLEEALKIKPNVTLDDGADTIALVHSKHKNLIKNILGGCEETTTGVIRLRAMAAEGALKYPVVAVNDAETKMMFDNRYGTGQSTIDGITRATNILWAGKNVVVCGYGWCGRGIAMRAKGLGSQVIVVEVEPVRALEAAMDGFRVMPLLEAAKLGNIFITVTGDKNVIDKAHLQAMNDGAIMANSGHFNVEINIPALESMSKQKRTIRPFVEEYTLQDGRHLFLLGEGRLINLAAAEGHPASVMDMSFANQALCLEHLVKNKGKLELKVYSVPVDIDKQVARLKLNSMGIDIDTLTPEQAKYLSSWQEGT